MSASARRDPLSFADREFFKTLAALVGAIIDRRRESARLDVLAHCDALTGLPNRIRAYEQLEALILEARRRNIEFALHFVDLNRFKEVNDQAGHDAGDRVLQEVARRLSACVRNTDTVARLGGDDFLILQSATTGQLGALELAERVSRRMRERFLDNGDRYAIDCSIGISLYPRDGNDA